MPHGKRLLSLFLLGVLISAVIGGGVYAYITYKKITLENRVLNERVGNLDQLREVGTGSLLNEKMTNQNLNDAIMNLNQALQAEQAKNQMFFQQIQQLSGTVGKLQKLSQTPPELLKKYSKVYFLNEHYVPSPLVYIDPQFLLDKTRKEQLLGEVYPFLVRMLTDAANAGSGFEVTSAYRSFGDQTALKTGYKITYGYGANQFSADQGYSEHQLGSTVDLTTADLGMLSVKFDASAAYKWLDQNAYRYGFILSYPKNNSYYQYEPWHWRFVGVALATSVHNQNVHFYDMPQSEIDKYLISIFD